MPCQSRSLDATSIKWYKSFAAVLDSNVKDNVVLWEQLVKQQGTEWLPG